MQAFAAAADLRFAALESGDPAEVDLWKRIVAASLEDFASFYQSLDISFDFVVGESFYAQVGLRMVDNWLKSGAAVDYGEAEAAADLEQLQVVPGRRNHFGQRVRGAREGHPQGCRCGRRTPERDRALRRQA